jgi:hypothetical protein
MGLGKNSQGLSLETSRIEVIQGLEGKTGSRVEKYSEKVTDFCDNPYVT